jgi:GT2 family glycosyltransferase
MNFNYSDLCTVFIVTYYSNEKIRHCLDSIPNNYKIVVFDNSGQSSNKKLIENTYSNVNYIVSKKNIGIPRAYSFGLNIIQTDYMFTTQPDVVLRPGCIDNLLNAAFNYPLAGILSPITYHGGKKEYLLDGDHKTLKIDKVSKRIIFDNKNMSKKIYSKIPEGDFCVEGVTGTAMLIKRSFLKKIGGWDKNIFSYWEDMDICARMRMDNFQVVKVRNAELDHSPFSSHNQELSDSVNYFRNWHYTWSSYYIRMKYNDYFAIFIYVSKVFVSNFFKFFFYYFFSRKKYLTSQAKLYGLIISILRKPSYYRVKK